MTDMKETKPRSIAQNFNVYAFCQNAFAQFTEEDPSLKSLSLSAGHAAPAP